MKNNSKQKMLSGLAVLVLAGGLPSLVFAAVPRSLPNDYRNLFLQKSIFSRDRSYVPDENGNFGGRRNRQTFFPPVFNGVIEEVDGKIYALMEDPRSGDVATFGVGGVLPQNYGRIEAINFDGIMIRTNNGLKQIKPGQNVSGGERPSADDIAAADLANGPLVPPAAAAGGTSSGGSATPAGGGDDAVAKLIAKRRAELQAAGKAGGNP